ncbi:16S rRNA pseudouridine(516) synthase [Vagococcus penaei]|uniref:Pseudouridine synthase n=1 Tax=Vagococcus penaei TaxID=633807 RepID=A0A1Q2D6P0_9ENTE|nr:16S rRNA pseudouridine(516) synthase [Vagococcus penaei]AQP53951.1 16S rRNA pseudouridine(516) synthase [Vagococcus penaei]RSU02884.1 16S rRNA pseudouridine(516) synthase [Vagococcus penaei]
MRLDKFLSHTGFGSRKEVKELLKKKRVQVNQVLVKDGKWAINELEDKVTVDGNQVIYQKYVYYLLNKPKGVVSATEDAEHRTVIDLIAKDDYVPGLFPIGRLDKDTTGLLLLTNDGDLAHQLLSPKKKIMKSYLAEIVGQMTSEDVKAFQAGMILKNGDVCLPAELLILESQSMPERTLAKISIVEGKYHQVKRMVAAVGKKVVELDRVSMAGLKLDDSLARGQYRPLTEFELRQIGAI